jgi:hypothetical protein
MRRLVRSAVMMAASANSSRCSVSTSKHAIFLMVIGENHCRSLPDRRQFFAHGANFHQSLDEAAASS